MTPCPECQETIRELFGVRLGETDLWAELVALRARHPACHRAWLIGKQPAPKAQA